MKILTIVGARPQFVKAAMLSRAIAEYNTQHPKAPIIEHLMHTGQHYDKNMSHIFFDQLGIPKPTWQLHWGNRTEGEMTGNILIDAEKIIKRNHPNRVIVFGDTDSTLGGALAAAKLFVPIVHVEAGLRSFNRKMSEEINRVVTDHVSSLLCCPTSTAVKNLQNEGITKGVHLVGDVMYDASLLLGSLSDSQSTIMQKLELKDKAFRLLTVHRPDNTEEKRIKEITAAALTLATEECPVIWPLHPRTRMTLEKYALIREIRLNKHLILTDPLGYLDMTALEKHALQILTDSGGVQKEAYFHRTPCITLRNETEWVETVEAHWNILAGYKSDKIIKCCLSKPKHREEIEEYGDGHAAEKILSLLWEKC